MLSIPTLHAAVLPRHGVWQKSCAASPFMEIRNRGIFMLGFTALELARIQFGFTISFHIIFPAITIGLASYLTVLEACWLKTKRDVYRDLYHFWVKIFAVN